MINNKFLRNSSNSCKKEILCIIQKKRRKINKASILKLPEIIYFVKTTIETLCAISGVISLLQNWILWAVLMERITKYEKVYQRKRNEDHRENLKKQELKEDLITEVLTT